MPNSAATSSRIRHVVFDLDGTLVDSAADIANAANHVRRARGLQPLPLAVVRDCIGEGARHLVARILPVVDDCDLDQALDVFLRHYTIHLLDETKLYPGITALLGKLNAADITCSVLSNKPVGFCRDLVDGLGIGRNFTHVLGGDSLPAKKPDPCGIHHLASSLQLSPSAMLLVGDSPIDRDTARAGGAAFCGVAWGFAPDALRASGPIDLAASADDVFAHVASATRPATC